MMMTVATTAAVIAIATEQVGRRLAASVVDVYEVLLFSPLPLFLSYSTHFVRVILGMLYYLCSRNCQWQVKLKRKEKLHLGGYVQ